MGTKFVKYNPILRRNERDRLMLVGAAGLALALLVVILAILNYRTDATAIEVAPIRADLSPVPAAIGTVTLLAPEAAVSAGTKLSNVALKEVYWPRNNVPAGAIRDIADVKNVYAKTNLPAGLPLTRENLSNQASQGSFALAKGHRAISIEGDSTSIVEGHVLPGSRVDVILTYVKAGVKTSKIIVENAKVLSLGGRTQGLEDPTRGVIVPSSSTVTLDVVSRDALKIQTAKSMGRISLMMRSLDDGIGSEVTEYEEFEVSGTARNRHQGNLSKSIGSVKFAGKEFMVTDDGGIKQIISADEP